MTALLEAEGLCFSYEKGTVVLDGADARLEAGRFTAILGPNGAGKSTLLRLCCGLLRPNAGVVRLDGQDLRRIPPRERARRIAFLPQDVQPTFSLTVFESVCLGRYPHSGGFGALRERDIDIAKRCLEETETAHLAKRPFTELSGGERRRVLLASALAQEPALLLLDEPTAGLDLHHEAGAFALLHRLARQGTGIAMVTHDLNRAARYCDHMLLLGHDHRVHADGPPGEVMDAGTLSAAYGAALEVTAHPRHDGPFVEAAGEAP